jgi:Bacterial Ig-like domain (group 3)/FG-GAP-like repeat/MBG domain (YGX type)
LSVLLGNGDGIFQVQVVYATGNSSNPEWVGVGDFNGDGKLDLVTTNCGSSVSVLLGNGDGTFQPEVGYAAGNCPEDAAVGDFNGDGFPDLAVTNRSTFTLGAFIYRITQTATATTTSGVSVPGSGTHLVDASYPSDANYASSLSSTTPLASTPVTTTIVLAPPPTSITYGQSVILTATLSPYAVGGLNTAGETVAFMNGATTLGTGTLNSQGVATLTLTTLPAGANTLTVVYPGDGNFLSSTPSSSLSFPVSPAVLTVTANNLSKTYGAANPPLTYTTPAFKGWTRKRHRLLARQL